eukprot:353237-Chlamydomonas_euryale.AAC.6
MKIASHPPLAPQQRHVFSRAQTQHPLGTPPPSSPPTAAAATAGHCGRAAPEESGGKVRRRSKEPRRIAFHPFTHLHDGVGGGAPRETTHYDGAAPVRREPHWVFHRRVRRGPPPRQGTWNTGEAHYGGAVPVRRAMQQRADSTHCRPHAAGASMVDAGADAISERSCKVEGEGGGKMAAR